MANKRLHGSRFTKSKKAAPKKRGPGRPQSYDKVAAVVINMRRYAMRKRPQYKLTLQNGVDLLKKTSFQGANGKPLVAATLRKRVMHVTHSEGIKVWSKVGTAKDPKRNIRIGPELTEIVNEFLKEEAKKSNTSGSKSARSRRGPSIPPCTPAPERLIVKLKVPCHTATPVHAAVKKENLDEDNVAQEKEEVKPIYLFGSMEDMKCYWDEHGSIGQ